MTRRQVVPAPSHSGRARYTTDGARQARVDLVRELERHGYEKIADGYANGTLRERDLLRLMGVEAQNAWILGDSRRVKIAEGITLLAAYLHAGKHPGPDISHNAASECGVKLFRERLAREHGKKR